MVRSVFKNPRCLNGVLALSLVGLVSLSTLGVFIGPALANPKTTSTAALFAGISDIQLIKNDRQTLSIHFEADLPFEYRIVPLDDHRIAIRLIQGKISQKLMGAALNEKQRLLNIPSLKGIERVTLLNPFPGMAEQHPINEVQISEIQISGKNIGKKNLIITGAQPADLTPAGPVAANSISENSIPIRTRSARNLAPDESFLRLSKSPAQLPEEVGEKNLVVENNFSPTNFRHIEMQLQPEKTYENQKPEKQKPLEPDPKWQVPPRPSSSPERTVAQERLVIQSRQEIPLSPKQTLPARDAVRPLPQQKSPLQTVAQPGHIQRPPHLTKDGRTEEGRFNSPAISTQPNESVSQELSESPSSPDAHFMNVSSTKTLAQNQGEHFSPWSSFVRANTIKRNPNAPPMEFSIIQTEPTSRRTNIPQKKIPLATNPSDGGILLQAVDATPSVKLAESPILPASKPGIVSQALKRALVQSKQGEYQQALLSVQQAKTLSPSEGGIYAAEGEIYLKMGALQKAKAAYEKAYALKPDEMFHERYAVILYQLGQKIEAKNILENLVTLNPQRPEAQLMLGTLCQEMGQSQKALLHLKQAVMMTPESADAQYNLATVWHSIGDTKQALRHYQQALRLSTTPKQQKEVQNVIQDLLQANGLSQGQSAQ
jgi:tetratricopeptide (TPR) repeat protein